MRLTDTAPPTAIHLPTSHFLHGTAGIHCREKGSTEDEGGARQDVLCVICTLPETVCHCYEIYSSPRRAYVRGNRTDSRECESTRGARPCRSPGSAALRNIRSIEARPSLLGFSARQAAGCDCRRLNYQGLQPGRGSRSIRLAQEATPSAGVLAEGGLKQNPSPGRLGSCCSGIFSRRKLHVSGFVQSSDQLGKVAGTEKQSSRAAGKGSRTGVMGACARGGRAALDSFSTSSGVEYRHAKTTIESERLNWSVPGQYPGLKDLCCLTAKSEHAPHSMAAGNVSCRQVRGLVVYSSLAGVVPGLDVDPFFTPHKSTLVIARCLETSAAASPPTANLLRASGSAHRAGGVLS